MFTSILGLTQEYDFEMDARNEQRSDGTTTKKVIFVLKQRVAQ
jgi:hypothetical protein